MSTASSGFAVRTALPEDLLAVLGVHARLGEDGISPEAATEIETQTWAHMLEVPGLSVYLSETNGDAVGTASSMIFPNITYACAPSAIIEAVVVVHEFRRQGVATALLQHILEDMRSAGCNKVQLLSHKRHSTDGAHRLYTSLGFEPEAEGFRLYLGEIPQAVKEARHM